jgi:S1-C subfamily serine protease
MTLSLPRFQALPWFLAAWFIVIASAIPVFSADPKLVSHLQDVSVTINADGAQGSGVMFNRKNGDDVETYVWTAAHVVDGLRSTRMVIVDGSPKAVVEFSDANIVREFTENGRRIGEQRMLAQIIRYSDAEEGEDLALLKVRKKNFVPLEAGVQFYLDDEIPGIGTELSHVGSLLGQIGANSYTEGVVSQIGRVLDLNSRGVVFDQTTATAFPGSSGGGVFLRADGRYVGMLVRGAGEQFNLIVPARRLVGWAKTAGVEWAVDPDVKMPSTEALKKLPVEDTGVTFGSDDDEEDERAYPTKIARTK